MARSRPPLKHDEQYRLGPHSMWARWWIEPSWVPDDYTITFTSPTAYEITDGDSANVVQTGAYTAGSAITFNGVSVTVTRRTGDRRYLHGEPQPKREHLRDDRQRRRPAAAARGRVPQRTPS